MSIATEYLEKLQKEAFKNFHKTPEHINKEFVNGMKPIFEEIISKYGITNPTEISQMRNDFESRQQEKFKIKLPTKYETISNYSLILDFADLIEKAIPVLGFLDKEKNVNHTLKDLNMNITRPIFGTLPAGSLNATSYGFSNGERLIVFESELLQFCNLISKIVAKAIPFSKEKGKIFFQFQEANILEQIEKNMEIFNRFKELIMGFLLTGYASSASQYILEAPFNKIADHLRLSMEVFIMGHEYAHILLRHLDSKETTKQTLNSEGTFNIIYSWQLEFDADRLGLPLMITALDEQGREYTDLSYCGADLFFSSYEIIEKAKSILKNGTDDFYWNDGKTDNIGTHPPSEKRRENLRKTAEYQFGSKFLTLSKLIEKIIQILWDKLRPELIENYKELRIKQLSYQVELAFSQKRHSDGLDLLDQILEIDENYIPALFGKGNALQSINRYNDADYWYDKILKIDTQNTGALVQKARLFISKKDYKQSLMMANKALEIESSNVYALYEKGIALDYLQELEKSIQCFDKILESEPENTIVLFRKAFVYEMNDRPYDALTYYDKVLSIIPNHEDSLIQKGLIFDLLGKYDEAIEVIDQLITINPDETELIKIKEDLILEKNKKLSTND